MLLSGIMRLILLFLTVPSLHKPLLLTVLMILAHYFTSASMRLYIVLLIKNSNIYPRNLLRFVVVGLVFLNMFGCLWRGTFLKIKLRRLSVILKFALLWIQNTIILLLILFPVPISKCFQVALWLMIQFLLTISPHLPAWRSSPWPFGSYQSCFLLWSWGGQ